MSYTGSAQISSRKVTTLSLKVMKETGKKIVCLTAYDALWAKLFDESGIDLILVGDSLGNVFQGLDTTIPVTLDQMIYHSKAVTTGASRPLVVADMPFMTYQVTPKEAIRNAGRLMKEAGVNAVKLEGGSTVLDAVRLITQNGIPVLGHLGLTPQSINQFGSYRARGVDPDEAAQIYIDALQLEEAGVFAIVLEKIPADLAKKISEALSIPTIGIGAGPHCDGQILVYTDMLGLTTDFSPRFVRRYAMLADEVISATARYVEDIQNGLYPNIEDESY
jgi:3-methyl-2-oxobutanoate hydroxymethyltransferase